jgi:hypothetical protein
MLNIFNRTTWKCINLINANKTKKGHAMEPNVYQERYLILQNMILAGEISGSHGLQV